MNMTDASRFYALLRFEKASLALRAVLRLSLTEQLGDRCLSELELAQKLGFTAQAARTFFALLRVMGILQLDRSGYRVTPQAMACLADAVSTSRKPYFEIGIGEDVDGLIELLRGNSSPGAVPLYGGEEDGVTIMDDTGLAREIAFGLSSRAKNFASPLIKAVAARAGHAEVIADIGAGSPFVARECVRVFPKLREVILMDRANGMRFVREIIANEQIDTDRFQFREGDFFQSAPSADVYLASNTAHDWRPEEYSRIASNIREKIADDGVLCIHEPLLMSSWSNDTEWIQALWMACYALTLFQFTLGQGTCYTMQEHHNILESSGFVPDGEPVATCDGCTALFYRVR